MMRLWEVESKSRRQQGENWDKTKRSASTFLEMEFTDHTRPLGLSLSATIKKFDWDFWQWTTGKNTIVSFILFIAYIVAC